jgi:hypothetical protein
MFWTRTATATSKQKDPVGSTPEAQSEVPGSAKFGGTGSAEYDLGHSRKCSEVRSLRTGSAKSEAPEARALSQQGL